MSFTEQTLEHAVIDLFKQEGYEHINGNEIHRELYDVLLEEDLRDFLYRRYETEGITANEINEIILGLEPSNQDLYGKNKGILRKLADGFALKRENAMQKDLFIELIDYENVSNNVFKIVNQLEIYGNEKRIPDAIIYVNGLPLVVWEFKSTIKEDTTIADAYTQLTVRYKRDIPELFKYNAFCVISDGVNSRSGSIFASYDDFYSWRKVEMNDEPHDGISSLHTMIHGLFHTQRLIDVLRNFIYFPDTTKHDVKIICRYPQYYAARKLFENIKTAIRPQGNGKGGTYFGATGCGKSYTMLFLTRLLMKSKDFANPTIILITDRTDLDDQLSAQFTNAKIFICDNNIISVENRIHLKELLRGRKSGGVFLTTIHKFTEDIELLTERNNIICISDEAHRSQVNLDQKIKITEQGVSKSYGFAKYLHDSLPNATFVGFTGTPIDATLDVFGDVIESYTMKESVEDNITVRIVYEGRAAKVLLDEKKLQEIEDYYMQCANSGTNEYQIEESKKAVTQMEVILGDPARLKLLAKDFVQHYEKRLEQRSDYRGKAMFVSSNRSIAYKLYKEIIALRPEWAETSYINLVMTYGKDDPKDMYNLLHSTDKKELDRQFKDPDSNFKIAIVVDMWLTGFDVPCLDTIYIDKPVKQHSLIQTISRINRVYKGKEQSLAVDYIGIKNNMNTALAKYSKVYKNDFEDIDRAIILVKDHLDLLGKIFHKFDYLPYFEGLPLDKLNCLNRAAEYIQLTDDMEKRFVSLVKKLRSAYDLCCGNDAISEKERDYIHFYFAVKAIIHKLTKGDVPDTAQMNDRVRQMIEEALQSEGIEEIFKLENKNDADIFSEDYLAKIERIKLPNTKIKLLQKLLSKAIEEFHKVNRIKGFDFSKKMKKLVELYNERKDFEVMKGDVLEDIATQFTNLLYELKKERESFIDIGIDFEEKAFYDILKATAEKYKFEYPENKLIILSREVKKIVDDKARYTDWSARSDIKAELKVSLILILDEYGYPPVPRDEVFKEIFEQAENFKKYN